MKHGIPIGPRPQPGRTVARAIVVAGLTWALATLAIAIAVVASV